MGRETHRDFESEVINVEQPDILKGPYLGALLKKFRLALLLTASLASGCSASYRTVRSYSEFEPIIGKEMTMEIPGKLTVNAEVTEGYVNINVQRNNTVKRFNRMTEREIQYEERETENLVTQFGLAGGLALLGSYLWAHAESEGENYDKYDEDKTWGKIFLGTGALVTAHGAYIALRGTDSKNITGKTRVVDTPVSENDVITSDPRLVNLRIGGDQSFPLGETDDAGHLRLTLEQLVNIIPHEQLVELLDGGETIFVEVEGVLSIAIDLMKMLPADERLAYEEYKKLNDGKGKMEVGTRFLKQYPKSLLSMKVKKQVDKLIEEERVKTETCVAWFGSHTGYEPGTYDLTKCIEATPMLVERFRARLGCREAVVGASGTLDDYERQMSDLNSDTLPRRVADLLKSLQSWTGSQSDNYYKSTLTNDAIDAAVERVVEACGGLGEETGIRLSTEVSERGKNVKIKIKRTNIAIERFNREISHYCAKKVCDEEECRKTEYYKTTKYNLRLRVGRDSYWLQDRTSCYDFDKKAWWYPEVVDCVPFQGTDSRCVASRCKTWRTRCATKP